MSLEKEIFTYLYELGCCKGCCLRYLLVRNSDTFGQIDSYIKEKNFLENEISSDLSTKKCKNNPCIVCLGLLQDFCIDDIVDQICNNDNISSYDSKTFTCSISFPPCVQIRERSLRIELDKKFPQFFTFETVETQLNKTWKWIIKDKLEKKLNKTFESSATCNFSVNVQLNYELNEEELSVLLKMQPEYFLKRKTQVTKFRGELFNQTSVQTALEMTKPGVFREFAVVPPLISDKQLVFQRIDFWHKSIYFAGRYCKYSRELSQTPWFINGVKTMKTSIQEIIFEPFLKALQISEDNLKFSASGREDVDVRCLGNGRPFYIECINPKKTIFSYEEFRQIEEEINKSNDLKVYDLQLFDRKDLNFFKEGEELKTKTYEAVCICRNKIPSDESLKKLELTVPLVLKQKTPIRVLHRRTLATRDKIIHSIKTERILDEADNLFKITVTTQAGTYVKEFVHGDFGRTIPNVGTIMGEDVDIVLLDVLSINLSFPKAVKQSEIKLTIDV